MDIDTKLPRPQTPPQPHSMYRIKDPYLAEIEKENMQLEQELAELFGFKNLAEDEVIKQYTIPANFEEEIREIEQEVNQLSPQMNSDRVDRLSKSSWNSVSGMNLPAHACSRHEASPTPTEKRDMVRTLKSRLVGATNAVRELEKQLKDKDNKVKNLEDELDKRCKQLEAYQSQHKSAQAHQKAALKQSSITSTIRKNEKKLEIKLKDNEDKLAEDKRTISRLHLLNKKLMAKVKEQEAYIHQETSKSDYFQTQEERLKQALEENAQLNNIARHLHIRVEELTNSNEQHAENYKKLLGSSMEFEEKTRELYRINRVLNENILKLLES